MTEFNGSLYYIASEEETSSELKREVLEGKKHEALAAAQPPGRWSLQRAGSSYINPNLGRGHPAC